MADDRYDELKRRADRGLQDADARIDTLRERRAELARRLDELRHGRPASDPESLATARRRAADAARHAAEGAERDQRAHEGLLVALRHSVDAHESAADADERASHHVAAERHRAGARDDRARITGAGD